MVGKTPADIFAGGRLVRFVRRNGACSLWVACRKVETRANGKRAPGNWPMHLRPESRKPGDGSRGPGINDPRAPRIRASACQLGKGTSEANQGAAFGQASSHVTGLTRDPAGTASDCSTHLDIQFISSVSSVSPHHPLSIKTHVTYSACFRSCQSASAFLFLSS